MADIPVGRVVRLLRKKRGMTQKQLAIRMGMSDPNGVYQMERDQNNPQLWTITNYAIALDIEPWRLMRIACKMQKQMENA